MMVGVEGVYGSTAAIYEIRVQGELDPGWEAWLGGLTMAVDPAGDHAATTLTGPVPDQSALRGLLCRLWDLNLRLVSVRRLEAAQE
jgi:hypothetical protein